MALVLDNLPQEIRPALTPVLERVVAQLEPQGLWLFGSWARGSQSARSVSRESARAGTQLNPVA